MEAWKMPTVMKKRIFLYHFEPNEQVLKLREAEVKGLIEGHLTRGETLAYHS